MATVTNPWGAVRDAIEEAAQDETLSPDARLAKLRLYADDLNDLLGRVSTYIGSLELVRDGRPAAYADQVTEARIDADLREIALTREIADAEELDALGYLSHTDLDNLTEEGLLDEWLATREQLRAVDLSEAALGEILSRIWDEAKHPRGKSGRFRDVLGRNIVPKGRHGRAVPSAPQAPGGERPRGFTVHHEAKHNAFTAKASEVGKFKETHGTPGMGSEAILGDAKDTQEKYSVLAEEAVAGGPQMPGGERAVTPTPEELEAVYPAPPGYRRDYSDERKVLHDGIVDMFFRQRKQVVDKDGTISWELDPQGAPVPVPDSRDRTLVFLAGGTASGKSVSRIDPRIANSIPHPQETVQIDPDEIKSLLPEYRAILDLGDETGASAVHEESSDLAKRILKEAMARGVHVVMDGTGDSKPGGFARKIRQATEDAKKSGHEYRTKVLYFDAPVDVALEREAKRAEKTGRKVHEHTLRSIHAGVSANFPDVQRLHDQGVIQDLAVHDTSNGPHLIAGDVGADVPRVGSDLSREGSEEEPVQTSNVNLAAALLAQGRKVELQQPRQVSTLLDRLAKMAKEAEAKGDKAPTFDLCKVSVKGTNLFCAHSKDIPRIKMPQFKGAPEPGSRADRELEKNAKGRVSLDDAWRQHLHGLGVRTDVTTEKASFLRATQNELNGANAARIMGDMKAGRDLLPIFVSRDNYILDGHHQWAGRIGLDSQDGKLDLDMPIERIDMPITQLLEEADRFTKSWGMSQRKLSD